MLPLPPVPQSLLRWSLLFGGEARVCRPTMENGATLTRAPGAENAFYYRSKLSKGLGFQGNDFLRLLAINESSDRCQPIGLLLETRPNVYAPWATEEQFVFSCNEADWDYDACTVTVTPVTDDAYRLLLENYDQEYNLLATPATRTTVSGKLLELAAGISIEFIRVGRDEQADILGQDGWALFLTNKSWIDGVGRETNNILFRYRLRNVPMVQATTGGATTYTPVDKSDGGWEVLYSDPFNPSATTIDYVKSPAISGFKAYKIGTYDDWNDPRNGDRYSRFGNQLLVVGGGERPSTYGFDNGAYLEVTGPDGFGANNAECQQGGTGGGVMLNLRREQNEDNCARIFWRFGDFQFTRCFPLLEGVYWLLQQTTAATGQTSLVPPMASKLSAFYTDDTNAATLEVGPANELPRLVLSAASDVKRYGASEPATRLMVSLKQVLDDLAADYDVRWFVDPETGWLRLEHRAYQEAGRATGDVLDLTTIEDAQLPRRATYRTQQLARYEELVITSASTQDLAAGVYFDKASIDYGMSACVNQREGQNRTTRTSGRLTGDVTAAVLSGDAIPDAAILLLAPDENGRLTGANRQVAASSLLLRYHRRGAAFAGATVLGQPLLVDSTRPDMEQAVCSVSYCSLRGIDATTRLTTNLGSEGQVGKAELDLISGATKFTPWLPSPAYDTPAPALDSRDYADSFADDFN